jgi:hypothetical protein
MSHTGRVRNGVQWVALQFALDGESSAVNLAAGPLEHRRDDWFCRCKHRRQQWVLRQNGSNEGESLKYCICI